MNYLRKIEWTIIPDTTPQVRRNCPKCGEKAHFINSEKFRVNANGSHIDIWLIYQCNQCKSTWNMTIYERINPKNISRVAYEKFLANDKECAIRYGFDREIHYKNKADLILEDIDYHVVSKELSEFSEKENEQEIKICCQYPIQIRMDKLLAEMLHISRSQVKQLCEKGLIYDQQDKNLLKAKVSDGMVVFIKNLWYAR